MCDTPSPREYIDASTDANTISTLLAAMKEGKDIVTGVICRTLRSGKPASILSVKHMRSYKNPGQIKYRLEYISYFLLRLNLYVCFVVW